MNKKSTPGSVKAIFINACKGFANDKVTKLSGSLAYSTIFSLGPLIIVIISLCGLFFKKEAIEGKIYAQLAGFIGSDAASQLQHIISNASLSGHSKVPVVIGVVTLILGATAIFGEIQDSINTIWCIRAKPKKGWVKFFENRLLSFSVIVGLGFLLLVSLTVSSFIDGFSDRLRLLYPDVTIAVFYVINTVITLLVTTIIFSVIFRVLPDAHIKWKDVFVGSISTALLFMLGKFAISFYISRAHIGTTYGAAGSIVILLLWIYYSSMILYFGAELTISYAMQFGSAIRPNSYAVTIKTTEEEKGHASVQSVESNK